jgi:hypothetical protein
MGVRLTATEVSGASTHELVDAAAVIAGELASRSAPDGRPGSAAVCMELAETLGRVIDLGEAALAGLVARVDGSGEAARWGFACTSAWLRHRLGMRTGRAKERLTLARGLRRLPTTGKLLSAGELSYGYAATITDALTRLDDQDAATGEEILLQLARDGASADQVAKAGTRISEVIAERDGRERPPEDAARGFKRSWIQRSRSLDGGSWVKGWLSPEHTAVWDKVVEPLTTPAGAADDRDHAERTADALFAILTQGHRRSTGTVIIELETLDGGDRPARLPDGSLITPERARQIALSAGISALIIGPDGRPLYLGRTTRFANSQQRHVLEIRYGTCAAEGCEIPSRLCEIHHTGGGWKFGVPTDIDRLAPLCSFHNQWVEQNPDRVEEYKDAHGRFTLRLLPPREAHRGARPPGSRSPSGPSQAAHGGTPHDPGDDARPQGP